MTMCKFPLRFQLAPFLRILKYTTAQLHSHTKKTAAALKPKGLEDINENIKSVDANGEPLLIILGMAFIPRSTKPRRTSRRL